MQDAQRGDLARQLLQHRPLGKESERPSEDADERRSPKAQDLNPPAGLHVITVPRADTENEPSSSSGPMDTDHGGVRVDPASDDHAQVRSSTPVSSSPDDRTNQGGKRGVQPGCHPKQSKSNTSSGIKRDARAAERPDEDVQGGKFRQVEGLTTADAEEIPNEFSVEDDFVIDENAEGVDRQEERA